MSYPRVREAEGDLADGIRSLVGVFIPASRPQSNGCVERVQRTILEECRKPALAGNLVPKATGLAVDPERHLAYYNWDRGHNARWTRGRTPEEVIGKVKVWP